jgi:uncharacterized phage-associated protein
MPLSANTIADWFLAKADEEGESLTPMKLLKLVYIAQGLMLAARDSPLFNERIEAWRWGPVVPKLYSRFSKYGSAGIEEQPPKPRVGAVVEEALEVVWDVYSPVSALELSALTHRPDTPWSQVYEANCNHEISQDLIAQYYKSEILSDEDDGDK